ncbi:MAG: putative sulfate/molybdate transporter, partial [Phycisphaerae bacterium]
MNRNEISGSLGDLGTFIPLLVGMVVACGLQLSPTLILTGFMNILTGLMFGIPMPVQPMKAIATIAIAEGLSETEILAAGIITGGVVLLVGAFGVIDVLQRRLPRAVIRGIQLALGLKLLTNGVTMIRGSADDSAVGATLGIICCVIILLLQRRPRWPAALIVFGIGLVVTGWTHAGHLPHLVLGPDWRLPNLAAEAAWREGGLRAAVPQIPLTLLNSVVAVCALSADLFPRRPASPRRVAISVGLINLIACPLGGMPACHGAGGLAAQYRFGARTGGSVVFLGAAKILLALLFGNSLLNWLQLYPTAVLGSLLAFGGLELATTCRDQTTRSAVATMLATAGVC